MDRRRQMSVSKVNSDAVDRAAGDWLARRDSGHWTAADQAHFERWLAASTLHRVAYLRLEYAWEEARRLKTFAAGAAPERIPAPGQLSSSFDQGWHRGSAEDCTRRNRWVWWATAASALLALAAYLLESRFLGDGRYSTAVGRVAAVALRDGSKVTLNTDSEVQVSVSGPARTVRLRRGEAYFEVAKDPARAFIVDAGDKQVIAVGTKFDVQRDAGGIRVAVIEGTVRIETGGAARAAQLVRAGSVAHTTEAGILVQVASIPEAEDYIAWLRGFLVFHDITLAEAAEEFNRYNARKIIVRDPAVRALRIAGTFRSNNVDGLARLLAQGYPIRVEQEEDRIVLESYTSQ
jgi:transmembrane sensor